MKFEEIKPEPQFIPVVVTLEKLEEVQVLRAVLAKASGRGLDGGFLFHLYGNLNDLLLESERGFKAEGRIDLKEI